MPADQIGKSNKLNTDTLLAALTKINWTRTSGASGDYDLFERDKWPVQDINFLPWSLMIWSQGEEATGLAPEERNGIKMMLGQGTQYQRSTLIMAGEMVAP